MRIAIGNDHAAVDMKNIIKDHLQEEGYEVLNLGTDTRESQDYPVFAQKVGEAVRSGEADLGIAICGTGIGMCIALNKMNGIRAACCSEPFSAKLTRQHNDSNVLCFGARVVGDELAKMIVDEWLGTEYMGGKHARRVAMLADIEKKNRECL